MSGFPNKRVFMLQIKGGVKKGGGLRSKNCFYLGTLICVFLPYEKLLFYQAYAKNVRVPSKLPRPPPLNSVDESSPLQ